VVAYAAEAFTKVPVTSDHQVVIDEIKNLNSAGLEPGTAIGEDFPLQ
jgi:Ca-activated chloride channel family protein